SGNYGALPLGNVWPQSFGFVEYRPNVFTTRVGGRDPVDAYVPSCTGGKLKINRIGAPLAVATIAAMALVGCTTTDPGEEPAPSTGGTITVAEVNELTAFTSSTSDTNLDMNGKFIGYTRSSFFYLDEALNLIPDTSFGT